MKLIRNIVFKKLTRKYFFLIHAVSAIAASLIIVNTLMAHHEMTKQLYVLALQMISLSVLSLGFLPTVVLFLGHSNITQVQLVTIIITTSLYSLFTIFLIVQRLRHIGYNKLDIYILFIVSPFIPVLDTFASLYLYFKEGKK